MPEKFTYESPAVNADEFLRGSPLERLHKLAKNEPTPRVDAEFWDDRPGDPP